MNLEIHTTSNGVLLAIQAQPGARRNGVTGIHDGRLKVAVTSAPEKGKANAHVMRVLAEMLGVSKSSLRLVSGETSSRKVVEITGLTQEDVLRLLAPVVEPHLS